MLFILLNQTKSIHFLLYTILGRFILVLLILGTSTFNILLSIVVILFVVIKVNENDAIYLEGFTSGGNITLNSSLAASSYPIDGGDKKSHEGFNNTERERNIQIGKNSKQIVTNKSSAENISAFDNYSESHSSVQ